VSGPFLVAHGEFLQLPGRRTRKEVDEFDRLGHLEVGDLGLERLRQRFRVEGDTATVGISNHAQEQLGDIVFAEVPEAGRKVSRGQEAAVVESVKAASDVYAPVSGEVIEGNSALADDPALINSDPEGQGWFFKLKLDDASELDGLMDENAYRDFVASL